MKGKRKKLTITYLGIYLCTLSPTLPGSFSSSTLEISSSHGLPSRNKRRRAHGCRVQKANSRSLSLYSRVQRSHTLHVPFPSQARTSIFYSDGMLLTSRQASILHSTSSTGSSLCSLSLPLSLPQSGSAGRGRHATSGRWQGLQRRASNQQASIRESQLSRELTPIMLWGELASSRCDWPADVFCQQC